MQLRPWVILAALSVGRVAFGYQFQTIASLAPDLVPRFSLSYAQLGSLVGAYMLMGTFAALPLGLLGRRFGDRWVLGLGLGLMTFGAAYSAWAIAPSGIAAGRTMAGLGAVAMIVLQNKIIAEWFTGGRFMVAISVPVCAFPVGMGLAQIILPPLSVAYGPSAALLTDAAPAALALILFLASYREPRHAALVPRRFSLPSRRECLPLAIAGAAWMVYTAGYASFAAYLPTALTARGYGLPAIGLAMTVMTWGNVPATLLGGSLAARFGGLNIFLVGTLSIVVGMVGGALAGWPVFWASLIGILGGIQPGVLMAVGTLSARPENRAVGMGIFYSMYYLGGTFLPAFCGMVADTTGGPEGGLLAAAVISATAIPLYVLHRALVPHATMLIRA